MTETKRFKLDSEVGFIDTEKCGGDTMTHFEVVVELNNLHEENEQLKESKKELQFQLNICADHRNEFHRGARENANRVGKLEKENEQLKRTISKIDFAIIRKYDNSLENLLDEVYDGEYNKWIKKQLSRAKKLDGDDEND